MRVLATLFLATILSAPAFAAEPMRRVQFDFHSSFLLNLHHFLFDNATSSKFGPSRQIQAIADQADKAALEEATVNYTARYARSDVFDQELEKIKLALSTVPDERRTVSGLALSPALLAVLERAAPAYARTLWPIHDQANRQWIRQARALDTVFGAPIASAIEQHLQHRFPATPARVDLVYYTGDWSGAYTSDDDPMQTVMPSARADYQGLAALEMLYHEVTHMRVNATLIDTINATFKAAGRTDDRPLWHAIHFYTVGEDVKQVLHQRGISYVTYADRAGIYNRGPFKPFAPLLTTIWQPYLQGSTDFPRAVSAIVSALPAP